MKRDNRPIHVLLIEDNPGDALLVEEYISEVFENFTVTLAETFREANKLLESESEFDSILLDLSLPDAEGMDLIDEMLARSGSVPLVILTGYTNLEFSMKSLSKGVSDYLLKDELSPTLLHKSILYSIERSVFSGKLKESEKDYRDLFELSPLPMLLYDLDSLELLNVNKAFIDHYGYSKKDIISLKFIDLFPKTDQEEFDAEIKKLKKTGGQNNGIFTHIKKNGDRIKVHIESNSINYEGRNARILLANDVTARLIEEERLKLLESVITNTKESVVILEAEPSDLPNRKILYVNEAFTETTGYRKEEVLNKPLNFLYGEKTDLNIVRDVIQKMQNWEVCTVELISYKKDGSSFWINTSFVPVADSDGNYTHWVAIARNVTERVKSDKELKNSLAEKEVLLSEIHHRVKNNLAIVSGLMQLQAFEEKNKDVERKLMDSVLRIRTMASIHELLYQSDSFSKVDFSEMIEKLSEDISKTMGNDKNVEIKLNQEDIELNINQAIPCALMINEVLTNAYKHAFTGRKKGVIEIQISLSEDRIDLMVKDDGVGLKESDESTLGMHLIQILTQQLEGEYSYKGVPGGTTFSLNFTKKDVKGAANALYV